MELESCAPRSCTSPPCPPARAAIGPARKVAVDERHRRAEPGPAAPPRQPTHPRRHCSHPAPPLAPLAGPAFQRPPPPPPPPSSKPTAATELQTYRCELGCRFHAATAAPTTDHDHDDDASFKSSSSSSKACASIDFSLSSKRCDFRKRDTLLYIVSLVPFSLFHFYFSIREEKRNRFLIL